MDKKTKAELKKFIVEGLVSVNYLRFKQEKREPRRIFKKKGYDGITLKEMHSQPCVVVMINYSGKPVGYQRVDNPYARDPERTVRDKDFDDGGEKYDALSFALDGPKPIEYLIGLTNIRGTKSYPDPKTAARDLAKIVLRPLEEAIREERSLSQKFEFNKLKAQKKS